jgi:ubiquinone/menaquinone biosynthesis C-methylase UbiE
VSLAQEYVLGHSASAARRLEIQDAHFAENSEALLDELALRPRDRVVELGCGPGAFSRRIFRRLGEGGVLLAVDRTQALLAQAKKALEGQGPARYDPLLADVATLGPWLEGADVVVGRAVLHHVPMVEFMLGRLRTVLRPGTRVGFIEPDFRAVLGRQAYLEATTRPELAPFGVWAMAINQFYNAHRLSPCVGVSLANTLQMAGYRNVRTAWVECKSDDRMIENILMFFDEVRDQLIALGILTGEAIDLQKAKLSKLLGTPCPPAWGTHRVSCLS